MEHYCNVLRKTRISLLSYNIQLAFEEAQLSSACELRLPDHSSGYGSHRVMNLENMVQSILVGRLFGLDHISSSSGVALLPMTSPDSGIYCIKIASTPLSF